MPKGRHFRRPSRARREGVPKGWEASVRMKKTLVALGAGTTALAATFGLGVVVGRHWGGTAGTGSPVGTADSGAAGSVPSQVSQGAQDPRVGGTTGTQAGDPANVPGPVKASGLVGAAGKGAAAVVIDAGEGGGDLVLPANAQAPEMDDAPVRLAAEGGAASSFNPKDPSTVPLQRRGLDGFKHLDETTFLGAHGISPTSKRYKASLLQLKGHLIGTQREKFNAVKDCEKRYAGRQADLTEPPDENNLGCSYWRVLQLAKRDGKDEIRKPRKRDKGLPAAAASLKRTRVRSEADWKKLSGASYYGALTVLDFRSQLEGARTAEIALKSQNDCSLANARAALVRDLEEFLPDKEAFETMTKVTSSLHACLLPSDEAFEIIHVRMGLLHLERARFNEAATHLELALQTESPSEEYRSLFWRGFVESLQHVDGGRISAHENPYWEKLVKQFPLTLHALVADEILGRMPYDRIASRPSPMVSTYAGKQWDRYNLAMFVTGLLIGRQEKVALERWSRYLTDNVKPTDFETGLFQAQAHLHSGNTRSGILTVFSVLRDFGADRLNPKVLELLYPLRYHDQVIKNAKGVDAALVMSLIRQESSFNPRAQSPVGARGLMQVMPATAKRLVRGKPHNLLDPVQNITIGTRYLAKLLHAHDDNYVFTLASYNAGPRPVNRWRERYDDTNPLLFSDLIPYPETRNYVSGLLRNMHWYRALLSNVAHAKEEGDSRPWTAATVAPRPLMFGLDGQAGGIKLALQENVIDTVEEAAASRVTE